MHTYRCTNCGAIIDGEPTAMNDHIDMHRIEPEPPAKLIFVQQPKEEYCIEIEIKRETADGR